MLHVILALVLAQPTTTQPEPDPLSGPKVQQAPPKPTLIERDFMGKIRRPEPDAVEAAAARLSLEGEAKAKVDKVFAERSLVLDKFVENNLDLLTKFGNAEHSTDKGEKLRLAIEAFQKLEPLREKGPLDKQVRDALPPEKAAQFDGLLKEYWDAIVKERQAEKPEGRSGIMIDEKLKDLGREIEAAFHRAEKSGGVLFGYLFHGMTLTDDQSKRLHELCAQYSVGGLDNKEKSAQAAFFLSVTGILDQDQRKEFGKRIKGGK